MNLICSLNADGDIDVVSSRWRRCVADLLALFKKDELKKYFTEPEIADVAEDNMDAAEMAEASS